MNHFCRIQRVEKDGCAAKNLRKQDPQQLSEYVAQRKQIEKSQRMEYSFVAPVALDLLLERLEIGQQISVVQDYSSRLSRCPGGKNNLDRIAAADSRRRKSIRWMPCDCGAQIFKNDRGDRCIQRREIAPGDGEAHAGFLRHASRESHIRNRVHGHGHGTGKNASEKRGHPFPAIFAPQKDALALAYPSPVQFMRELLRHAEQACIRPPHHAIAAAPHNGDLVRRARIRLEIFD